MAGRIPKPWFWEAKQAWYVSLHGKRIRLGKHKSEAIRQFHRLMAGESDGGKKTTEVELNPPVLTVEELTKLYLADLEGRTAFRTQYVARCYLKSFRSACGMLPVTTLKKHHVETVIRQKKWNPTTENHVKSRIVAVFNWGVEQGFINANPIKGIRKPQAMSRGSLAMIERGEHEQLMASAPPYLRDVLFALHETGARPCEVLTVEAKDFDPEAGIWVIHNHKTKHHTGKPRILYLTLGLTELCKLLTEKHPSGPLFRRHSGKPFPPAYYLARLLRQLCKRIGLRPVTPYFYRHSFATDALANGVPDAQVAELLGHSGTAMLHRHYAHLGARTKVLRDALGRVR